MAISEQEWMNRFGDNLAHALKERGITQRELADEAGLSESSVSEYIRKRKMPGVRAIVNMADVLDMTIDELVDVGEQIY